MAWIIDSYQGFIKRSKHLDVIVIDGGAVYFFIKNLSKLQAR